MVKFVCADGKAEKEAMTQSVAKGADAVISILL
jgi:hypothetical protein